MKKVLVWRFDELDGMPMQAVRLTLRTVNMRGFGEVQRLVRLAVQTWDIRYPLEDASLPLPEAQAEPAAEGEEQAVAKKDEPRKVRPAGANGALDIYLVLGVPSPVHRDGGHCSGREGQEEVEVDWDCCWIRPWSAVGGRAAWTILTPCLICRLLFF